MIVALGAPKTTKDNNSFDLFLKINVAIEQGAKGLILFYPKNLFQDMAYKQMHSFLDEPVVLLNDSV